MPYLSKDLSVLAYANGFTLWHYATDDTAETVVADGYFNPAADMFRAGDQIVLQLNGPNGHDCAGGGSVIVSSSSHGAVSVIPIGVVVINHAALSADPVAAVG